MRRPRGTNVLAAVAAATLVLPGAALAQGSGAGSGRIAYSKIQPTGGARLFVASPDGTAEHEVPTPDLIEDFGVPVWSPDGTRLLVTNMFQFDGARGMFFRPSLVDPDGTDYHLVPAVEQGNDMYCHAWSPDASRLLCGIDAGQPGIVSVRATDGGDARRLTTNPFGSGDVAWSLSPDGTQFAFLRYRPGPMPDPQPYRPAQVGIFVANLDGSHVRQVVPYGFAQAHEIASASWSPDGRQILSTTKAGRLFVARVDGQGVRQLTLADQTNRDFAFEPAWSPDGTRIIFSMFRNGQPDLYSADPDGRNVTQVTNTPDFENGVAWSAVSN